MVPEAELLARLRLAAVPGVRADALRALIAAFGTAAAALRQDAAALAGAAGLAPGPARRLLAAAQACDAERELREARRAGVRLLLLPESPEVPDLLKSIPDPPILLYCLGALEAAAPGLAVVGSRRPTPYGARMARRFGREAGAAGLPVVSGLARGVDTEAHRAALEAAGRTWAALGSGLLDIYPKENAALARRIADAGGAVLSEYPLRTGPSAGNFPRRNRLISGLAAATVVVEGAETSGALITARLAAEQGREVCAVPGPADSDLSAGPLRLLKAGATPAASLADVLEAVPALARAARRPAPVLRTPGPRPASAGRPAPDGSGDGIGAPAAEGRGQGEAILRLLRAQPRTLDDLAAGLRRGAGAVARELVELEMRGLVVALGGQRYGLK